MRKSGNLWGAPLRLMGTTLAKLTVFPEGCLWLTLCDFLHDALGASEWNLCVWVPNGAEPFTPVARIPQSLRECRHGV
jgi:hypothetical protein